MILSFELTWIAFIFTKQRENLIDESVSRHEAVSNFSSLGSLWAENQTIIGVIWGGGACPPPSLKRTGAKVYFCPLGFCLQKPTFLFKILYFLETEHEIKKNFLKKSSFVPTFLFLSFYLLTTNSFLFYHQLSKHRFPRISLIAPISGTLKNQNISHLLGFLGIFRTWSPAHIAWRSTCLQCVAFTE